MPSLIDLYTNAVVTRAYVGQIKTVKAERLVQEIDTLVPLIEPLVEHKLMQHYSGVPSEAEGVTAMIQLLQLSHDESIQRRLRGQGNGSMLGTLSASIVGVIPDLREVLHDASLGDALGAVVEGLSELPEGLLRFL